MESELVSVSPGVSTSLMCDVRDVRTYVKTKAQSSLYFKIISRQISNQKFSVVIIFFY